MGMAFPLGMKLAAAQSAGADAVALGAERRRLGAGVGTERLHRADLVDLDGVLDRMGVLCGGGCGLRRRVTAAAEWRGRRGRLVLFGALTREPRTATYIGLFFVTLVTLMHEILLRGSSARRCEHAHGNRLAHGRRGYVGVHVSGAGERRVAGCSDRRVLTRGSPVQIVTGHAPFEGSTPALVYDGISIAPRSRRSG